MPQKTRMIALVASLFLFPAALAAGPGTAPATVTGSSAGYGPGQGPGYMQGQPMMRGGCKGIMRTLTPEQHAMHFHDMQLKMDTLTVTKFRAWRAAECTKLQDPAARAAYAKALQARWDKLSDKEKLSIYHDMLARKAMRPGPRHGKRGGGRGMNR